MLRGIAVFSMKGRWQAAIAVTLLSLSAMTFPPLMYLASGLIALTTLRMGPKEGAKVVAATTLIVTLFAGLALKQIYLSGALLASSWLPIFGISLILGYTRSLALSLLAATGLGIVLVLGMHLVLSNPALWWQEMITPFMAVLAEEPTWPFKQAEMESIIMNLSKFMTGFLAAGFSLNVILGLLIGRSWQAKLYNPGGFTSEFQQLTLGKPAAVLVIVTMLLAMSPLGESLVVLRDCLPVMLVVFSLQGLSVIHMAVKHKQKHTFWLVAVYIMLVLVTLQMVALLAMIGVLEQWFNFRQRLIKRGE